MTIKANMTQRDLVRLSILMCGDRPGEKYTKPGKGVHYTRNADPSRGFSR